jgi:holin-like protein
VRFLGCTLWTDFRLAVRQSDGTLVSNVRRSLLEAGEVLLGHLSLLFIPVGVGVITHLDMISNYGARLLVVIVVSTWMGMAVTAVLLNILLRKATFSGTPE